MGDKPSACIAQACLRKSAEKFKLVYPESSDTIIKNSYMDDITGSAQNGEEVNSRTREIDEILENNGFRIKEWIKTGDERKEQENNETQSKVRLLAGMEEQSNDISESVLGMQWDPKSDTIGFQIRLKGTEVATKRSVLSTANAIYDPLGLVSPITVNAKIILRQIWAESPKIGWDDELPKHIRKDWNKLKKDLVNIIRIRFPRSLSPNRPVGSPSLIVFSDGSTVAYGTVAYIRWATKEGNYSSRIIAAKSRVAPIKIIDIVRLELCGAVLGARLRDTIIKETNFEFDQIIHLVDSEIVHAMVNKDSYGFGTFVANRVGEIQRLTNKEEWKWVEGSLNAADAITRGCQVKDIEDNAIWINGPPFLKQPESEWPVRAEVRKDISLPETKKKIEFVGKTEMVTEETLESRIDPHRFSKWSLLLCTTARILQLYQKYRRPRKQILETEGLSLGNMEEAKRLWIKDAQKGLDLKKCIKLRPREVDGIVVVGNRAERWMASTWNKQEFILLPKESHISFLIASELHNAGGHLGEAATIAKIRSRYWIISIKKLVREIIKRCTKCIEKLKSTESQQMSSLPIERLKPCPAFTHVGIDYFGRFNIKGEVQKRVAGKCFGVLLACMTSRAIHLDIASNYSTDEFLHVLRRFASFRGWPRKIFSDRGTQLVGASNELKAMISKMGWNNVEKQSLLKGTEWQFSPADAPWYNGPMEALVKCTKRALHAAIGENTLRFSEFQTVMYEVAQLVNQRPIGNHPKYPDEQSYLCPNDLLLGRASPESPQMEFETVSTSCRQFNFTQSVISAFWRRWIREAFPNLVIQQKWHSEKRNLTNGDVVLVQDSNIVRGQWKKALVVDAQISKDGKVRKATITYRNDQGTRVEVDRPVQRLIVLVPTDENRNGETGV